MKLKEKPLTSTTTGLGMAFVMTVSFWTPTAAVGPQGKATHSVSETTPSWVESVKNSKTATTYKVDRREDLNTNSAFLIKSIQDLSQLSIIELGKIFQVSRRSIHNWANGSRISEKNAKRVKDFHSLVSALGVNSPEERRSLLLSSSNGQSLVEQFILEGTRGPQLQRSLPVMERLG